MFSIGEQLYRPSSRDEETLLVEPFFNRVETTVPGVGTTSQVGIRIPFDRCLYIHEVSFVGGSITGATGNWTRVELNAYAQQNFSDEMTLLLFDGSNAALQSDNGPAVPAATAPIAINRQLGLLLPPGLFQLIFKVNTTAKTGDGLARFQICGYLLPPGRIGRR